MVEVLVAVTIGAMLLMTAAYTAGAYSQAVAALKTDAFSDQEMAMARIMQDVRYGYWVQFPTDSSIEIGDHRGRVRSYFLDGGGSIIATHHDSTQGILCSYVTSLTFEGQGIRRLREGTPQTLRSSTLAVSNSRMVDRTLALGEGGQIAIPFTISTDHAEVNVSGVVEQVLGMTPTILDLPITSAMGKGSLRAEIFPARAPGDPRPLPRGVSLGSATVAVAALPDAVQSNPARPADVFEILSEMYGVTQDRMVGMVTTTMPLTTKSDYDTLITFYDSLVIDGAYDAATASVVKRTAPFVAPAVSVPIDVTGSFSTLQPGVAYTMVISVESGAGLSVLATATATSADNRVALKETRSGELAIQDYQVAFSLSGERTITATTSGQSIAVVYATLVPATGNPMSKATPVYSQALATDPWHGALPGETSN